MNDDEILMRGGTEHDIESYANQNGADLTKDDVIKHAEFQQLSNDMFWNFHEYDFPTGHFHRVKWTGYNDDYWWNKVAQQPGHNVQKCDCGKKFELNYSTNEVKEVK